MVSGLNHVDVLSDFFFEKIRRAEEIQGKEEDDVDDGSLPKKMIMRLMLMMLELVINYHIFFSPDKRTAPSFFSSHHQHQI